MPSTRGMPRPPRAPNPHRRLNSWWLLGVFGSLALFLAFCYVYRFIQDDSYISLQYARNFVDGHGLVFNPGERVEGYTNFSWTLLLALLLKWGAPALSVARVLGVGFALAALVVACRFSSRLEGRVGPLTFAASVLMASTTAFAFWAGAGLETGLVTFLLTWGMERAFSPATSWRGRALAPVIFAIAALTRPDAALFFVAWMGLRVLALGGRARSITPGTPGQDTAKDIVQDVAVYAALVVPFLVWKWSYYGSIVPNTYFAKGGFTREYFERGLTEAVAFVKSSGLGGVAPLLALSSMAHPVHGRLLRPLVILLTLHVIYMTSVGGDVLPLYRLWLPIVPLGAVAAAFGLEAFVLRGTGMRGAGMRGAGMRGAGARAHGGTAPGTGAHGSGKLAALGTSAPVREHARPHRTITAALVLFCLGAVLQAYLHDAPLQKQLGLYRAGNRQTGAIVDWLAKRVPPGEGIAATAIGQLAYVTGRPVIDMLGLTDFEVARHPESIPGLTDTWREKKYNAASVLRRRPKAILFSTGARPSANAEKALFLYEDFHRSYFPLYFRADPTSKGTSSVYWRRDDAPPPPQIYVPSTDVAPLEAFTRGLRGQASMETREEAAAEFARAAEAPPPFDRLAAEWSAALRYETGDPGVIPDLEAIIASNKYALRAMNRLAHHHTISGNLDRGESLYRAILEVNPDDAESWEGLGEIARRRGQYQEAVDYAAKSVQLWSTNPEAYTVIAMAAGEAGRFDIAERALLALRDLEPNSDFARQGLEFVRSRKSQGSPP